MEVIEDFGQLWSLEVVADSRKETKKIQTTLRIYRSCIKIFVCVGLAHLTSFIIIPLIKGGNSLPYQMWLPNDSCYILAFVVQIYVILVLLFLVCGIDALFIALCGSLGIQFRLLSYKIKQLKANLEEEFVRVTLKECLLHEKHLML